MKIAISSEGNELTSKVDPRFGRARYFIIYDTESKNYDVRDNGANINTPQGAGIQTAQNIAREKVAAVISGNVGPKAFTTLSAAGIKIALWSEGTVSEAIELFENKKLKIAEGANVEGHWQ